MSGLLVIGLLALTACTPPTRYGARLNEDGTVDFVLCDMTPASVEVDYSPYFGNDWEGEASTTATLTPVVRYGSELYEASVLRLPPDDWTTVTFNGLSADRSDLTEGEWTWFTEPIVFVPDRPCSKVSERELER